jgi:hypothetical protein
MRTDTGRAFLAAHARVSTQKKLRVAWCSDGFFDLRNGVGKNIPSEIKQPFCLLLVAVYF